MALEKSIFDELQKSIIKKKVTSAIDINKEISYETYEIKPMTSKEYSEMNISFDQLNEINNPIINSFRETANEATHTFSSFNKSVDNIIKGIGSDFKNGTEDIIEGVNKVPSLLWSGIKSDIKSSSHWFLDSIAISSVPVNIDDDSAWSMLFNIVADFVDIIPSFMSTLFTVASTAINVGSTLASKAYGAYSGVVGAVGGLFRRGDTLKDGFSRAQEKGEEFVGNIAGSLTGVVDSIFGIGMTGVRTYSEWLSSSLRLMEDTFTNVYQDGVSETKFGKKMEETWKIFVRNNSSNVTFNTLINPISSLGTEPILFGTPPRYVKLSDPRDRSYINTFIKDGNIVSLLPGKPKYNGLNLSLDQSNRGSWTSDASNWFSKQTNRLTNALNRSGALVGTVTDFNANSNVDYTSLYTDKTAEEYSRVALDYLKRNGISDIFNENDKRYYTFEQDLSSYYSYLETILNTIYVKMGLGELDDGKTELFSFFDNYGTEQESLNSKYSGKSLGFYFDGNPSVSEGMSNDTTDPADLKGTADVMSDEFQKINYITGFGTRGTTRKTGVASARLTQIAKYMTEPFKQGGPISQIAQEFGASGLGGKLISGADKVLGAMTFTSSTDLNAMTEALLSTNGMKTEFPRLWTNSNYSKSVNVEFEFISPYGDPLSIFQYVYTPLAALLALALPKQAAENSYVNPFFLRMDIPGVISSDFAIISNITWIRGGSHNLWTVDRHPRAMTVSVVFEDLYQFLALTKRISYLSANPNYSMFLDSFAGIRSLHTDGSSINNDYWDLLVNRLNANNQFTSSLWNKTRTDEKINRYINDSINEENFFKNYYKRDISWMKSKQ